MTRLRVIDFETNGTEPTDEVIELGWLPLLCGGGAGSSRHRGAVMGGKVLDAEVVEAARKLADMACSQPQAPEPYDEGFVDAACDFAASGLPKLLSDISRLQAIIGPLEGLRELSEKATPGPWNSAAKALLKTHRQAARAKRTKPPAPKHVNAPTRVHDRAYLAFLRRQPCHIGGAACGPHSDPCHIRMGKPGELPTGMGRKPDDRRAVPMCRAHHDEQHRNERAFWAYHGEDPFTVAEAYYARFEREAP